MKVSEYRSLPLAAKRKLFFSPTEYRNSSELKYKINADYLKYNTRFESVRELLVSYLPMYPLIEETVPLEEADYILYSHHYARIRDFSQTVESQIRDIASHRKHGAQIIVVGKSANIAPILNGTIDDIIFIGDHFTEKLGNMFDVDIKEEYFVYNETNQKLNIWPVDGCLSKCAFCRRTYMDIKFESLPLEYLKSQLDYYAQNYPEKLRHISLRAENLTEYGIDLYGYPCLHKVIDLITSYKEVESIELPIGMSIGEITPEILAALCNSPKIKNISLNIETGSNRLLKLINKKHTKEQATYIYKELRKFKPGLKINTTVMIGLPTEELIDIFELAELIGDIEPDSMLINYYGMCPKHPLASLPQISSSLREYHLKILLKLLKNQSMSRDLTIEHRTIFKKNSPKSIRIKAHLAELQQFEYDEVYWGSKRILKPSK